MVITRNNLGLKRCCFPPKVWDVVFHVRLYVPTTRNVNVNSTLLAIRKLQKFSVARTWPCPRRRDRQPYDNFTEAMVAQVAKLGYGSF